MNMNLTDCYEEIVCKHSCIKLKTVKLRAMGKLNTFSGYQAKTLKKFLYIQRKRCGFVEVEMENCRNPKHLQCLAKVLERRRHFQGLIQPFSPQQETMLFYHRTT